MAGDIRFRFKCSDSMDITSDMERIDSMNYNESILNAQDRIIPIGPEWASFDNELEMSSDAKLILVIEKEGIFRR